jgi:thiamine kinase-like enzyme
MIEGLPLILKNSAQPGLPELREFLQELLGGPNVTGVLLRQQTLQPRGERVFRLCFVVDGKERSVIVKRLSPEIARRNELVARRWLPAAGLQETGPPLLGSVAARQGHCVWHVYDDLGSWELDPKNPKRAQVESAVRLIARIHLRFARHPLLGEIRLHGGDLGMHFYETNVRDAITVLEAWNPTTEHSGLRGRLLKRLRGLRDDSFRRAQALADLGGPETLLHGDLWAINVFVIPTMGAQEAGIDGLTQREPRWRPRLIDWDHAAVGPATYDLSTFLMRFPAKHRSWVLDLYQRELQADGWTLPAAEDLNFIFETHEYARFANRIIWPAIGLVQDNADWGIAALKEIEQWFEQLEPVLSAAAPGARSSNSARPLASRRAGDPALSHEKA